ncbi:membrane protein [Microbacterium phage Honk]|uniref:Membrane protein n=1 Tax=Microbacterium phage Honk TaxID=2836095 RepID=A0A8F3IKA6_9CAUD|nr:membrane protein [Microbacterium phage Honk]
MSATPSLNQRIASAWVAAAVIWAVLSLAVVIPVGLFVNPPALATGLILIALTLGASFWAVTTQEVIRRLRADAIEASVRRVLFPNE